MDKCTIKDKATVTRRIGKPKLDWVHENRKSTWGNQNKVDKMHKQKTDKRRKHKGSVSQYVRIISWAIDKKF